MTEAQKEAQAKLLEWKERRKARTYGSGTHPKTKPRPPSRPTSKGYANDIPEQLQGGHENILSLRDELKQMPHTHAIHRVMTLKDEVVEPRDQPRGPEVLNESFATFLDRFPFIFCVFSKGFCVK